MQRETLKLRQQAKKKEENPNKFTLKTTKPRSNNVNQPVGVNPNLRKKIDNVNTEFIRYISERQERKSNNNNNMPANIKDEEEEE